MIMLNCFVINLDSTYFRACLPKPCDTIGESNTQLWELGWGANAHAESSDNLMKVNKMLLSVGSCKFFEFYFILGCCIHCLQ